MIRMAVRLNGLNPDLYALHSLRCGGAAALYRATGDLDLVARFGRWKGNSIHGYLWESHLMLQGIASLMAAPDGPIVHFASGGLKSHPGKSPLGGFRGCKKQNGINDISF